MNTYIKYIWLYFWLGIHRAISRLEVLLIRGFVNFDLFNFLFFYIGTTGILKRSSNNRLLFFEFNLFYQFI